MATLPQLKALAKRNKIRCKCLNKTEIIALLIDRNIITTSDIFEHKIAENKEPIACQNKYENKKYDYLKGIRNNPKRVEVFDPQTDETSIYASKYKAGRALDIYPMYFKDGAILKDRYVIKVV